MAVVAAWSALREALTMCCLGAGLQGTEEERSQKISSRVSPEETPPPMPGQRSQVQDRTVRHQDRASS